MKSLQDCTTVIRPDDNGTFVAYVPAISGCHACGLAQTRLAKSVNDAGWGLSYAKMKITNTAR